MERCHHGVREPKRTSAHGRILDINERTGGAVTRIFGGRHSTIAAEEFVPVGDLDGRQVLGQRPTPYGLKMGKTPRRNIFKYAEGNSRRSRRPIVGARSDPGERILLWLLEFQAVHTECNSARVADVWRVDTPRPMRDLHLAEVDVFSNRRSRWSVATAAASGGCGRWCTTPAAIPGVRGACSSKMKILKATSRTISTKFLSRQLPSRARWPQGGKRRRRELTQGNEAACHLTVTGEGDADFEGVAPALRFG